MMTLCRKGLFSCSAWHIGYSLSLASVFIMHLTSAPVVVAAEENARGGAAPTLTFGRAAATAAAAAAPRIPELLLVMPVAAAVALARFKLGVGKYALWSSVVLLHWAAMHWAHTLDSVVVSTSGGGGRQR